ncbi:AAA family ATPase [Romboutsia timonensis]|uniref:AAA family ATPase n=1 Tax=Romboutsia timonensis TaxID=1776391 RepID=UPI00265D077E|nr:AAA family ATPase [uncultured Clostridium sp.]
MKNDKWVIRELFISNFKPFPSLNPPKKINFTDSNDKIVQFLMLSGFNGYGKTSIFQAIEFALSGKNEIFEFKDTNKKYSEHISVNELDKESLIALELYEEKTKIIKSIIRYNKKVKPCKESECKKEYKDYELYIIDEKFNYNKFKEAFLNKKLQKKESKDIAFLIGENSIGEWISSNYIKQEQSSNILFKTNNERVDFINQFINKESEEYFIKFSEELTEVKKKIEEVKKKIEENNSIQEKIKVSTIGEEPQNIILFPSKKFTWDKEKYTLDEDFEYYISVINDLEELIKNIDIYCKRNELDKLEVLLTNKNKFKNIIIYSALGDKLDDYINIYNKKLYLEKLISSEVNILESILNYEYLNEKALDEINEYRKKKKSINEISNSKQDLYLKTKDLRDKILGEKEVFKETYGNECPVCGKKYNNSSDLLSSIEEYDGIFKGIDSVMSNSMQILIDESKACYDKIINEIKEVIVGLDVDSRIIENIKSIKNDKLKYEKDASMLETIINRYEISLNINNKNIINVAEQVFDELSKIKNNLFISYNNYKSKINNEIYTKNKEILLLESTIKSEEFVHKINKKKRYIEWLKNKKNINCYKENDKRKKELYSELEKLLICREKLNKIISTVKFAKDNYMSKLISYIEIPLYIYSGKLLQTHQNGLGVFCTTGPSDKVTQFKLTVDGKAGSHDILNKFSSGQKAVINIAIMLAFRKIRKSNLDLFLIDDPCQSMDDINIASLTEILKNEFRSSQLVLSTHDKNIAAYMCYKYHKGGNSYKNFNVQEQLYEMK